MISLRRVELTALGRDLALISNFWGSKNKELK